MTEIRAEMIRLGDELRRKGQDEAIPETTREDWLCYLAGAVSQLASRATANQPTRVLRICTVAEHDPAKLREALTLAIEGLRLLTDTFAKGTDTMFRLNTEVIEPIKALLKREGMEPKP